MRGRLAKLEARRPPELVRVTITRQVVGGGAREDGEGLDVVRVERREFTLYPDGVPGRWAK